MTDNNTYEAHTLTESELQEKRELARRLLISNVATNPTGTTFFVSYLSCRIPEVNFSDEIADDVFDRLVTVNSGDRPHLNLAAAEITPSDIARTGFHWLDAQLQDKTSHMRDYIALLPEVMLESLDDPSADHYGDFLDLIQETYDEGLDEALNKLKHERLQKRNNWLSDLIHDVSGFADATTTAPDSNDALHTDMRTALNDTLAAHIVTENTGATLLSVLLNHRCPYLNMPAGICADLYTRLVNANANVKRATQTTISPFTISAQGFEWLDKQLTELGSAIRNDVVSLPFFKDVSLKRGAAIYQSALDSIQRKYAAALIEIIHELDQQQGQIRQASAKAANAAAAEFLKQSDAPATNAPATGSNSAEQENDAAWQAALQTPPQAKVTKQGAEAAKTDAPDDDGYPF